MEHWDEIRTAAAVARLGTVSHAAKELGLHRATISRHVDTLETALGARLFHRNPSGYVPTEAGEDLLRVAQATEEQFRELEGRIRGATTEMTGELVVTSVAIVSPLVLSAVRGIRKAHPETTVRYEVSDRPYRLDYGEATVAIRAGRKPDDPDNIVQPFMHLDAALYAHQRYLDEAHAEPAYIVDARGGTDAWLEEARPGSRVALSVNRSAVGLEAIDAGVGIGFCPVAIGRTRRDWVQVEPPRPTWTVPLWLVTHTALHRTAKVQTLLAHLKAAAG